MNAPNNTDTKSGFRAAISEFLQQRLDAKLKSLKSANQGERSDLIASFEYRTWLNDAAQRANGVKLVTHIVKAFHNSAKGTQVYARPADLKEIPEIGTHVLQHDFVADMTANAADLDVASLLMSVSFNGKTLFEALSEGDAGAVSALDDDPEKARQLRDAFLSIAEKKSGPIESHVLSKQIYWLAGSDACDDSQYILMSPLYPSSLVQEVYKQLDEARFGEQNKIARQSKKEQKWHDGVLVNYPGLAVQKLGGSKPHNISQLNSGRRGVNYLLSCAPPDWRSTDVRLPTNTGSVFERLFMNRTGVRQIVKALIDFLESDPASNYETRTRRTAMTRALVDELVAMAATIQTSATPGWSLDGARFGQLSEDEKLWLDPMRASLPGEDEFYEKWMTMEWVDRIGKSFSLWLNGCLSDKLPVGDIEARVWRKELLADEDGFKRQLSIIRGQLKKSSQEASA